MQTAVESKLAWAGARDAELQTTQPCLGDRHHPRQRYWTPLKPCLGSSSPSSPFHTLRMFQGQEEHAFSRHVCHLGYTAVSIGKPNYRCDKWEKSNPCCPKRSGKKRAAPLSLPKEGFRRWRSKPQTLKNSSCYLHLLHLVPQVLLRGCSSSVLMQKWWSADKVE